MATLVQQPELEQVQLSSLQATQRPPETEYNLSDFTLGLLGVAKEGLDAYDKENKDRLIALGASDYMNEYTREVNVLERRNYQQGQSYSEVLSAQTQRRQTFQQELDRMAKSGSTSDEIFEANKEFLQSTVNDIYGSTLDSDLKEGLYQETLKENIQYQKLIGEKLQAVAIDRYTNDAQLLGVSTVQGLQSMPRSPQEQVEFVQGQYNAIKIAAINSGYAKTEEEADKAATGTLKGTFDFWFKSIDPTAPDAAESLNQLRGIAENLFANGMVDVATDVIGKVNDVQAKVLDNNTTQLDREFTLDLHNFEVGAVDYKPEDISAKFVQLEGTNLYDSNKLNTWYSKYLDTYTRKQEKLLEGQSEIDPLSYGDYFDYELANGGKGRDQWIAASIAEAGVGARSETEVANRLIMKSVSSSKYMPELITMGMERATTELAQWARLTDAQLKEAGGYEAYKASWAGLVQTYQQLALHNPMAAEDMLGAIDSKYFPNKEVLRSLLATGAPLNSARDALNDPVGTGRQLELANKAIDGLTIETAKLDKFWTTGNNGSWFNRISEESTENVLEGMKTHAMKWKGLLASSMSSGSAANLTTAMEKNNLLLKTQYTPVLVNPQLGAQINSSRLRDAKGQVVARDHVARAIDATRFNLAKQWGKGVRPEEVLVTEQGGSLYFTVHDKTGNLQNTTGSFGLQGAEVSMTSIVHSAATIRDIDVNAVRSKTTTVKRPSTNSILGVVGTGVGTYNVRDNAIVKKSTVRLHGSGKRVPVNIPASATKPFGNNIELTSRILDHWNTVEGFVPDSTYSPSTGSTSKGGNVIGWGVRQDMHPEYFKRIQSAGSIQEKVNIQAEFFGKMFKENKLDQNLKRAGIPAPTTAPYNKAYQDAFILVADSTWHGGGTGGSVAAKALAASTYAEAERIYKGSAVYKAIGKNTHRNQFALSALRQFHNHKALRSGQPAKIGWSIQPPQGATRIPFKLN